MRPPGLTTGPAWMPDLVAIASPGRQRWIIIRSAASQLFIWRGPGQSRNPACLSPYSRQAGGSQLPPRTTNMRSSSHPGLSRVAVSVGCPGQARVQCELLFSVQMVWCMLWGEWAPTRPRRPRFGCMNPARTAGFRYPLCPHPATGPPPSCMGTRSTSWVRARGWGRGKGAPRPEAPSPVGWPGQA